MSVKYFDRVIETTSTSGTGVLTLLGPQAGFRSFSVAGNGALVPYIIDDAAKWEIGIGTVNVGSPNTLARTTVLASSNSGALESFGSNVKNVRLVPLGGLWMSRDEALNFTDLMGVGGGAANAHTVTMPVTPLAYTNGALIMYRATLANTAAGVTVNVTGPNNTTLGAKPLKVNGTDPAIGLFGVGTLIVAVYNKTTDVFDAISPIPQPVVPVEVPPGAVMPFAMSSAPSGWLSCDGTVVSRTTYAALFTALGTVYGAGDGSTTFGLPDLRGEFIRGWDNGRGVDTTQVVGSTTSGSASVTITSTRGQAIQVGMKIAGTGIAANTTITAYNSGTGAVTLSSAATATGTGVTFTLSGRAIGSFEQDDLITHQHTLPMVNNASVGAGSNAFSTASNAAQTLSTGGSETRSRNIAMLYCIKT